MGILTWSDHYRADKLSAASPEGRGASNKPICISVRQGVAASDSIKKFNSGLPQPAGRRLPELTDVRQRRAAKPWSVPWSVL